MKKTLPAQHTSALIRFLLAAILVSVAVIPAKAGTSTWSGLGANTRWSTAANWDSTPTTNDFLIFTGSLRLLNTNNFDPGTSFKGISFLQSAGAFELRGNVITLAGGITNNQPVTEQT